ncbi:Blue-light-activated protein [compost metagenome]
MGYAVIEAADGASALKRISSDIRLDLLICDLGLPGGMNGRQVAEAAQALRPGLKVLFISGYGANGADAADPVLPKPYALEDLARHVHALLRAQPSGPRPDAQIQNRPAPDTSMANSK